MHVNVDWSKAADAHVERMKRERPVTPGEICYDRDGNPLPCCAICLAPYAPETIDHINFRGKRVKAAACKGCAKLEAKSNRNPHNMRIRQRRKTRKPSEIDTARVREIVDAVLSVFGVDFDKLTGRRLREGRTRSARDMISYLVVVELELSGEDAASALPWSHGSVTRGHAAIQEACAIDSNMIALVERIRQCAKRTAH